MLADAEKYTLNVDQPDIEKDEDLMSSELLFL